MPVKQRISKLCKRFYPMCKTEQYQFEELLAYHCAPTLKGYKIANMFHVSRTLFPCAEEIILEYNEKFRQKGLDFSYPAGRTTAHHILFILDRQFYKNPETRKNPSVFRTSWVSYTLTHCLPGFFGKKKWKKRRIRMKSVSFWDIR